MQCLKLYVGAALGGFAMLLVAGLPRKVHLVCCAWVLCFRLGFTW